MADSKRVVRKITPDKLADFDEQWWPVTLLLLVSAAALAGYVYNDGDFDHPLWYRNARVQLYTIGASAFALVVGVALLRGSSQRRLQLGVFLSLAFHLGLIYFSHQMYLTFAELPVGDAPQGLDEDAPVVIPDYIAQPEEAEAALQELIKPAETKPVERKTTEMTPQTLDKMKAEKQAVVEPEPQRDPQPTPTELARVELTAPRRNEVLSGEQLSRKTLAEPLPSEKAPLPKPLEGADPQRQLPRMLVDAARQEQQTEAARRPTVEARANLAAPQAAPAEPAKRSLNEQMAAVDVQSMLERRMRQAIPESTPAPQTELPAMARPSLMEPRRTATIEAAAPAEQRSAAPQAPAQRETVAVTISPGAVTSVELSRAETPQPSEAAAGAAPSAALQKRSSAAAAPAGTEFARIEAPAAPTSDPNARPGGAGAPTLPASVARGNSGAPEVAMAEGVAAPQLPGAGIGDVVGSPFAGPQRSATVGAGESGQAAGVNLYGRAGRGRTAGTASVAAEQVASLGAAGVVGPNSIPGNSTAGGAADVRAVTGGAAAGLGQRMATQEGPTMRAAPSGGTLGNGEGPTGAISGTGVAALGSATGGGSTSASGAARRELGDGVDAERALASGPVSSPGRRGKISTADGATSLAGAGMIALPQTGVAGAGAAAAAPAGGSPLGGESPGGSMGVGKASLGIAVLAPAPEGPGGFSSRPSLDIGLPTRRARPESELAHLEANRLMPERLGGKKTGGGAVRDSAVAGLKQRDPDSRGDVARAMGGSEQTERAVEMGLDFLARHQAADGSWRLHDFGNGRPGYESAGLADVEADTAGTGLALLAFLGAGYTHRDAKYGDVVEKGLAFLLRNQKPDGDLFVPPSNVETTNTWLYSHGIASIALCEALGMSRDDELLKGPAQRALDFIVQAQDPQYGGWRYRPRWGSDTSVSGWQLMALKSGERVGLQVPPQTYSEVMRWLDFAQAGSGNPSQYVYRPQAQPQEPGEDVREQRSPSRVMTAEALLMRQYLGWNRDNPNLTGGADYLLTQLPDASPAGNGRDSYYWYYATQVMFHMKGDYWQRWNERLRPLLVDGQTREGPLAGSWDPLGETPDRWGGAGGRVYVTAMHLLMLEVYYRYLPLYQNLE